MPLGATRFGFQAGVAKIDVQYLVLAGGGAGGSNFSGGGGRVSSEFVRAS